MINFSVSISHVTSSTAQLLSRRLSCNCCSCLDSNRDTNTTSSMCHTYLVILAMFSFNSSFSAANSSFSSSTATRELEKSVGEKLGLAVLNYYYSANILRSLVSRSWTVCFSWEMLIV